MRKGRVHEVCGPSAFGFAAVVAGLAGTRFLWVRESWQGSVLNPVGGGAFFDPAMLLVAQAKDQLDALAVTEEALRDGSMPVVIVELSQPLSLKAGRRLQLAAKAGRSTGLCIIPEGMGSNAAETRWHSTPIYDPKDSTLNCWKLIKNKTGTNGAWNVRWQAASRRLHMVSPAGE
ncbi:hypothetical protein GCM10011517_18240 [Actibacterium pelagium]|uniref:Protein ImuA n=1 Tax=Actibacterium pelagium TaxID=2029103 RepID=A0A917AGE4_9RHOB|nr:hypothetical protein GCM10011517_18240 [Actibacterium pelagium]